MNTWKMAHTLIAACGSPQDVEETLVILDDRQALREVRRIISGFSMKQDSGASARKEPQKVQIPSTSKPQSVPVSPQAIEAAVRELESLFRASKMTNKDVESWIRSRFDIDLTVGKDALNLYLRRVLQKGGQNLISRITAAALREMGTDKRVGEDLREYWDQTDRHLHTSQ